MWFSRSFAAILLAVFVLPLMECGGSSKPISVTVSPMSATLNPRATQQFTANVSGGHDQSVTWNVNGAPGGSPTSGTVSAAGLYTAPSSASAMLTANVQAISTADSSKSATATVKVVPKGTANTNRVAEPFPIELGTSGGNSKDKSTKFCCSGTLGALVNRGGSNYILSANHVLARSGTLATPGDAIIQPGLVDVNCTASRAHVVAHLSQFAPLKTSNVDAALALITPGSVDTTGGILEFGSNGGAGMPASGTVTGTVGMPVAKSGRSTGLTCSSISAVSTTVKVDYQPGCNTGTQFSVTFKNQLVIGGGSFSSSGDSGALIVNSQTAQPVGLLYAGSATDTVANPINDVLSALADPAGGQLPSIVGGAQHAIDCSAASQSATAPIEPAEIARATAIKERNESRLGKISGVVGIGVSASADDPGKAAISIYVSPQTAPSLIPQEVDGVRTQIHRTGRFVAQQTAAAENAELPKESLQRAAAAMRSRERDLLVNPAILGMGVGRSEDDAAQPAIVIFVDKHQLPPQLPRQLEGVRTHIVYGERFRATGWNEKSAPSCSVRRQER